MSAYVDDELGLEERRRFERHADLCPECGPMRRTLLWLKRELRGLRSTPERSVASAVIERWNDSERAHASSDRGERDGW
jgi:anti-sigma factor RsiW